MKRLIALLMLVPSLCFAQGEIVNQPTRTAAQVTDKAAAWLPIWDQNGGARNTFKLSVADLATLTSTLTNGDKGDITLSGSPAGSVWTVDAGLFAPFSHTHVIANITGLQTALDGKAALSHTHVIGDTMGLQAALDGKAALAHSHAIADVTNLQTTLNGKAALVHTHVIGDVTGLQTALDGKAALTHSHVIGDTTGLQAALDGKAALAHTHAIADTTGLQAALDGKAALAHSHAAADINSGTFASARFGANTVAHSALANTSANGRLIGSPAGGATVGEITLGSGLTLTGSTLSATASGGGTPGGADTQIQFNNAGAFGGSANLTFSAGAFRVNGFIHSGAASSAIRLSSAGDGVGVLTNDAGSDLSRICLGGTTSSFPALKRSGTAIHARLGDDSAFAGITGSTIIASASASSASTLAPGGLEVLQGSFAPGVFMGVDFNDIHGAGFGTRGYLSVASTGYIGFASGNASASTDVFVSRDAAGILAQRRTTNANSFRVYRTYQNSGTDHERGVFGWHDSSGVAGTTLRIGTEKGGTGASRAVSIVTDGTEKINVSANGNITLPTNSVQLLGNAGSSITVGCPNGNIYLGDTSTVGGQLQVGTGVNGARVRSNGGYFWSSDTTTYGPSDAGLARTGAAALKVTNGSTGVGALETGLLTVSSDQMRITTDKTPTSATDTGVAGTVCIDDNYIYVCTATNTWKRAALSTW